MTAEVEQLSSATQLRVVVPEHAPVVTPAFARLLRAAVDRCLQRLELEVDPASTLSPDERRRRAIALAKERRRDPHGARTRHSRRATDATAT